MAQVPVDFMTKINIWVVEPAKRAYDGLESHWNSLGRKVSMWTDTHLPNPWNSVAKKIFSSLPIAAAIFVLPFWVGAIAGAGYYLAHLGYGPFSDETHQKVFAGGSVGCAAVAAYNTAGFISTFRPGYAIGTIVYGVMSAILFPHSKLIDQRTNEAQK